MRARLASLTAGILSTSVSTALGAMQADVEVPEPVRDVLNQIMGFLYTAAHWIGKSLSDLLGMIWPAVSLPVEITDSFGFLAVLTAFLVLAEVAKKLAWIVLVVGWALILTRVAIILLNSAA